MEAARVIEVVRSWMRVETVMLPPIPRRVARYRRFSGARDRVHVTKFGVLDEVATVAVFKLSDRSSDRSWSERMVTEVLVEPNNLQALR